MTDEQQGNNGTGEQAPASLNVLAQFVKDLSFENPNAPGILATPPQGQPQLDIQVNVNARQIGPNEFEVELAIEAKAQSASQVMFIVELTYSGIFRIAGAEPESLQPIILIECPRLLFPFARQILAEATRNGGYPPLMLDPIDFVQLYRQRLQNEAQTPVGTA